MFTNKTKKATERRDAALLRLRQAVDEQNTQGAIHALNDISVANPEWNEGFDPNDPVVVSALDVELQRFAAFNYEAAHSMLSHLAANNNPSANRKDALTKTALSLMERQDSLSHEFARTHLMTIGATERNNAMPPDTQKRLVAQWNRAVHCYVEDDMMYDAVAAMSRTSASDIALLRQNALQKWQNTIIGLSLTNPDRARELVKVTLRDYARGSEDLKTQAELALRNL